MEAKSCPWKRVYLIYIHTRYLHCPQPWDSISNLLANFLGTPKTYPESDHFSPLPTTSVQATIRNRMGLALVSPSVLSESAQSSTCCAFPHTSHLPLALNLGPLGRGGRLRKKLLCRKLLLVFYIFLKYMSPQGSASCVRPFLFIFAALM